MACEASVTPEELRQLWKSGRLTESSSVWKDGMANWLPLGDTGWHLQWGDDEDAAPAEKPRVMSPEEVQPATVEVPVELIQKHPKLHKVFVSLDKDGDCLLDRPQMAVRVL